jgi:hypothetical protein
MGIDFEGMYWRARAEATDVSEHLLHYLDTIKSPLWRLQLLALLSPRMRSVTQERAKHQEEVMQIAVLTALPSAHINAALTTTQLNIQNLYHDLSAGYETPVLATWDIRSQKSPFHLYEFPFLSFCVFETHRASRYIVNSSSGHQRICMMIR